MACSWRLASAVEWTAHLQQPLASVQAAHRVKAPGLIRDMRGQRSGCCTISSIPPPQTGARIYIYAHTNTRTHVLKTRGNTLAPPAAIRHGLRPDNRLRTTCAAAVPLPPNCPLPAATGQAVPPEHPSQLAMQQPLEASVDRIPRQEARTAARLLLSLVL